MKKDTLVFLAGAATGLAIGVYLSSEKGSKLREQLSEHWDTLVETLGAGAQEKMEELLGTLNDLFEKGLVLVENLDLGIQDEIQEVKAEMDDLTEEAETAFEAGMGKARLRLQQQFAKAGLKPEH